MEPNIEKLLGDCFSGIQPVTDPTASEVERRLNIMFPDDFRRFYRTTDGGEGFINETYVVIWRLEELAGFNEQHSVAEYAPSLFLFGSDGAGEGFAFDVRSSPFSVVSVPFIGMSLKEAVPMGASFVNFLEKFWG
jgi:hypothetical protein